MASEMTTDAKLGSANAVIRRMRPEDAPQVSAILGGAPEAVFWAESEMQEVLGWGGVLALVIEFSGTVTSFLLARQAADEAEILNLAAEKAFRRKGQGGALLRAAEKELRARGVQRLFLEVRESNTTGIAFYKKHGFSSAGRRPGYYREPEETAILMEKKLRG